MQRLLFPLLVIICSGCFNKKRIIADNGGGEYIAPVADSLKSAIRILHFHGTTCVIFPAKYAANRFNNVNYKDVSFFTPDTAVIKKIPQEIINQYCTANKNHWTKVLFRNKPDSIAAILTSSQKKLVDEISYQECLLWQANSYKYDKQCFAYIKNGERIIRIQLIDFTQDPHHLKPQLTVSWIDGWHGWFYSNIINLYYHVDKNLITIDEDS